MKWIGAIATAVVFSLAVPSSAQSQPYGPGMRGSGMGWEMGPGMMMGPGRWRRGEWRAMCRPQAAGFGAWRVEQIEQLVKPDEKQRKAFDEFRAASDKAAERMSNACPTEIPRSVSQRLAFMETRMTAMLDAIKMVRPAFDVFYATLNDDQKRRLDTSSPRRWGWHRWRSNER